MAFQMFAAMNTYSCLLVLMLVVISFLCPPLGVDALPVTSRHRRTADSVAAGVGSQHRPTTGGADPETRPDFSGSMDEVDSWAEASLDGKDSAENEEYDEQTTSNDTASNSAPSDSHHPTNHSHRRRELNEALTSRMLREQRHRRQSRHHVISALQAMMNNLPERAVCGWTYRNNHNVRRIPADLPEAVCDSLISTIAGTRNRCEQVYYNVPVKTLGVSSRNIVTWSANWLALRVGCTLAAAGTIPYSLS